MSVFSVVLLKFSSNIIPYSKKAGKILSKHVQPMCLSYFYKIDSYHLHIIQRFITYMRQSNLTACNVLFWIFVHKSRNMTKNLDNRSNFMFPRFLYVSPTTLCLPYYILFTRLFYVSPITLCLPDYFLFNRLLYVFPITLCFPDYFMFTRLLELKGVCFRKVIIAVKLNEP